MAGEIVAEPRNRSQPPGSRARAELPALVLKLILVALVALQVAWSAALILAFASVIG